MGKRQNFQNLSFVRQRLIGECYRLSAQGSARSIATYPSDSPQIHSAILDAGERLVNKWWSVSWKRVGIALLLVFGSLWLVCGVAVLISYQLRPWLTAREFARNYPEVNKVPVAVADKSLTPLTGMRVEFYGFSFQTPWKDITRKRTMQSFSVVSFNDGAGIMVTDPAQDLDRFLLDQLRANHAFDDQTLRSNYALRTAEMAATSEQIKWWKTPSQNAKHLLPFMLKLAVLHDSGALYSVSFGEFHGFQKGNPSVAPYRVELDLFDGADQHYQITFSGVDPRRPFLTQAEINAMIASLRRVPAK
jgi:hypothetical protein